MMIFTPWEKQVASSDVNGHLSERLGKNVARLRTEQGLNKKTFSMMCGIGRPLLDAIERGRSDVRLSYVQRLADALSVHPLVLLSPPEEGSD